MFPDQGVFGMADNHAKVMAFQGVHDGVRHYPVCTGSANLASNARIEDYVITNDEGAYAHYAGWIAAVMRPLPLPS